MHAWARYVFFPILFATLIPRPALGAPTRWEWAVGCARSIAQAVQWLRRDPNGHDDPQTLTLAEGAVPPSENRVLNWLAGVRPYLNPQVAAAITRGLQIFPEVTNDAIPPLPEPNTADRRDLWDNLLSKETSEADFEALLLKAQELLNREERMTLARHLFARGIRSAMTAPQQSGDTSLQRSLLLVRNDSEIRDSVLRGMRRQFPALGSLPEYGED
ncbi:MAG: hypothetical protein KDD51_01775 [Bdellovibrionales bacterium]|nr:hypothetical protein [Bdellovibrionales bacterium]